MLMDSTTVTDILVSLAGHMSHMTSALLGGGVVIFIGNYYLQRELRRLKQIDALKQLFYDFLEMAAQYWLAQNDEASRKMLEARILVTQRVILMDYGVMKKNNEQMAKSHRETGQFRCDLWDQVTGGCFQGAQWSVQRSEGSGRFTSASIAVGRIIQTLY